MDSYIGEIRMFAGTFAPQGWATCDGQLLNIADNEALFALIGTTYGGDGETTFGLPDLRGRVPVHISQNYPLAARGGVESVTLTSSQMPAHTHIPQVDANLGSSATPSGQVWSANDYKNFSSSTQNLVGMNAQAIISSGGGQPHDNMMPSLAITFIISLQGIYPNQS